MVEEHKTPGEALVHDTRMYRNGALIESHDYRCVTCNEYGDNFGGWTEVYTVTIDYSRIDLRDYECNRIVLRANSTESYSKARIAIMEELNKRLDELKT